MLLCPYNVARRYCRESYQEHGVLCSLLSPKGSPKNCGSLSTRAARTRSARTGSRVRVESRPGPRSRRAGSPQCHDPSSPALAHAIAKCTILSPIWMLQYILHGGSVLPVTDNHKIMVVWGSILGPGLSGSGQSHGQQGKYTHKQVLCGSKPSNQVKESGSARRRGRQRRAGWRSRPPRGAGGARRGGRR